jgi:hypothetical protein
LKNIRLPTRAACAAAAFFAVAPAAAQLNMELMQKWAAVTVVRYTVVGQYAGDTMIINAGTSGYAMVKDRIEIVFDWDQSTGTLVGEPTLKNFPSDLGEPRNGAQNCRPPKLNGSYEHATVLALKDRLGGQIEMSLKRDFPAAEMPTACTGGAQAVPARSVMRNEELVVPGTMILAMPASGGGEQTVTPDGKSIVYVDRGWTWTYTPTPVR